jgi:hypothetical protein
MPIVRLSHRIPPLFCLGAVAVVGVSAPLTLMLSPSRAQASKPPANMPWWSASVENALSQAGANRPQILAALMKVPAAQREGLAFLVDNMPVDDLHALSATYLLTEVSGAYSALAGAPWAANLPHDVFLNEILPYACLNEARDDSRAALRAKCLPLIAGCKTSGEAAQALNRKLFPLVRVKYSTARERPDQNPTQTMKSGLATCSGLSILLVDACRSVGIPARVVGVPNWSDNRGNHTWVEVWDGDWHFAGAAEPDDKGLDHGWFTHDASLAKAGDPAHAIYAASFRKTGSAYPLVWAPDNLTVHAVNVTARYVPSVATPVPADRSRLQINVVDAVGHRVPATVTVRDIAHASSRFEGVSPADTTDRNNFLSFDVPRDHEYEIAVRYGAQTVARPFHAAEAAPTVVEIRLPTPIAATPLRAAEKERLRAAAAAYFARPASTTAADFPAVLNSLLRQNEAAVREIVWAAYRGAPIHADLKRDFENRQVRFGEYISPFTLKTVGTRPAGGWPLFIAMHGGGNGPKEMNDSQWQEMQIYYRDHPEVGGYQYLALRAPNDTWNGFYDVYVYPLIHNLVEQNLLFNDVDPDKVFLMGYSHGGYGAFAIGPKEPDLFAAVHASAGAPTDGETTAKTLRNTVFTVMVGGLDTAYGRLDRDQKFDAEIKTLRGDRSDTYPVSVEVSPNTEHSFLKDRDKIPDMYPAVRNPVPRELTWLMTDNVIKDFYWLQADRPDKGREIDARIDGNRVTVTTANGATGAIFLDSRLVDFTKPVTVSVDGKVSAPRCVPSLRILCDTMAERGDPGRAFTVRIPIGD